MKKYLTRKNLLTASVCLAVVAMSGVAMAGVAPTVGSTDIGGDFYDFAHKLATGPAGWTVGLGGTSLAGFFLFKQQLMPALGTGMGVMAILKSPSILTAINGFIF